MRHLHFTQSLEPLNGGGLGSSAVALHRQMRLSGLQSVLCATHGGTPQRLVEEAFEFPRIKPDAFYFSPALKRQAPQLVSDADVLHGHGLYVGTNFVLGRESRRQSKPLVYHAHGFFEPWILKRSVWKKRLVQWAFEDANFRSVRLWRALTAKEADQIRACGVRQPIVIAPNGLDPADFSKPLAAGAAIDTPLVRGLRKTRRRLLFLGRIHPKKGLDLLLPAWGKLGRVVKDWELIIAGPDEQGYLSTIQELSRSGALPTPAVFTGAVTGGTKVALLHSADLFVLPSYSEGFSMSILEAMACGVSVVATRACNFPELSREQSGWECEPTLNSLAEVLRLAIESSDSERMERGQSGRRLVETHYAWPSIIKTLLEACAAHC